MNKVLVLVACLFLVQGVALVAQADDDWYGVIESRPEGKVGKWTVGGRTLDVTDKTDIDQDHGALLKGTCVEVEIDDEVVEEIESEPPDKCAK
jgi:hypothetical protein